MAQYNKINKTYNVVLQPAKEKKNKSQLIQMSKEIFYILTSKLKVKTIDFLKFNTSQK